MPVNREFTIRLEDRPGTLGKVCQALADQNINILAFQQLPLEKGKGGVRLVLDNSAAAKTTLDVSALITPRLKSRRSNFPIVLEN